MSALDGHGHVEVRVTNDVADDVRWSPQAEQEGYAAMPRGAYPGQPGCLPQWVPATPQIAGLDRGADLRSEDLAGLLPVSAG